MSRIDSPRDGALSDPGQLTLYGVAFAGDRGISRVEVSVDGGQSWADARLAPAEGRGWTRWEYDWRPGAPGRATLASRATDARGNVQPELEKVAWNKFGYGMNAIQRVPVEVTSTAERGT
jgi:hypothetical protein